MARTYEVVAPDEEETGRRYEVVPPEEPEYKSDLDRLLARAPSPVGMGEAMMHFGSGMLAFPAAAVAGPAVGLAHSFGLMKDKNVADVYRDVPEALTYQPRSNTGKALVAPGDAVMGALSSAADSAGGATTDFFARHGMAGRGAATGAVVNAALQTAPALLMHKAGTSPKVAAATERVTGALTDMTGRTTPAIRAARTNVINHDQVARNYVVNDLGMDWDRLPVPIQRQLTTAAENPSLLAGVDKESLVREIRAASLPVADKPPLTRGQATRDPSKLSNESLLAAGDAEAGAPIRDVRVQQNTAILESLDSLRGTTGGKITPDLSSKFPDVGRSVQDGALQRKVRVMERNVDKLYADARKDPAGNELVDTTPLFEKIEKSPDRAHFKWADSWLKTMEAEPGSGLSVHVLEDLRKAAVKKRMNYADPDAHYAGELISEIERLTEGKGGESYARARAAHREVKTEFDDQRAVRRLVRTATRTDRALPVEKTFQKIVLSGSAEELAQVRKSLLTGGNAATQAAGLSAWKNLGAATLEHIKNRAGKGRVENQSGKANVTHDAMKSEIERIGDEKLRMLLGDKVVDQLYEVRQFTHDVKTQPDTGLKGSPTKSYDMLREEASAKADSNIKLASRAAGHATGHYFLGEMAGRGINFLKNRGRTAPEVRRLNNIREAADAVQSPLTKAASDAVSLKADIARRQARQDLVNKYLPAAAANPWNASVREQAEERLRKLAGG